MSQALTYRLGAEGVDWWVAHHIPGCARGFGPCYTLGVFSETLVAGVVFHNHNPESGVMEMSAAAIDPKWMSRRVIYTAHDFIFNQMACQMAVLRVSEENERMRRIGRALGYREYRIPRLRGRKEAEILMTLADDDWRNSKWGKKHG